MEVRPFVAIAIIVNQDNEFLLIRRARPPFRGEWSFISGVGASKKGYPPNEAVQHEVSYDIGSPFKGELVLIYRIKDPVEAKLAWVYLGAIDEHRILPNAKAVSDWRWFSHNQITKLGVLAFHNQWMLGEISKER